MLLWMLIYLFSVPLPLAGLDPVTWHAHEMIYGYAIAVVAGFLLTAVSNWTGVRTWRGKPLAALLACWFVARGLDGGFHYFLNRLHPAADTVAY